MELDFFEMLEEPLYLFAAGMVALAMAGVFLRRGLLGDAVQFGLLRYILVALFALWFMLSPVAPLLGFAGSVLVACVSPPRVETEPPSDVFLLRGVFGGI